jgi:transposase
VKKYLVRLTPDEQTQLSQMIRSGKAAARRLLPARLLLKADMDSAAPAWSDEAISEALEVHSATVARVRQRFVEEGLDTAWRPRPSKRQYARKLDGAAEAQRWAIACGPAPAGQARWSLRLLADRLVEWEHVGSISYETIRRTLKKTSGRRTGKNTGRSRPSQGPSLWPRGKTCWRSTNAPSLQLMQ